MHTAVRSCSQTPGLGSLPWSFSVSLSVPPHGVTHACLLSTVRAKPETATPCTVGATGFCNAKREEGVSRAQDGARTSPGVSLPLLQVAVGERTSNTSRDASGLSRVFRQPRRGVSACALVTVAHLLPPSDMHEDDTRLSRSDNWKRLGTTMRVRCESDGRELQLQKVLGSGGEGKIYEVPGAPRLAAKIYDDDKVNLRRAKKLEVMRAQPPNDPTAQQGHTSIAWPVDLLQRGSPPQVVGFLMPWVSDARSLFECFSPKMRIDQASCFNYHHLYRLATNLAATTDVLHRSNYVIGDINGSNFLAVATALVTLVDTDSMQVRDSRTGTLHRCPVARPDYTPPEEQRGGATGALTPAHDLFGLAVLIFQLLMEGHHPFLGGSKGTGNPVLVEDRIAAGQFAYARHRGPVRPPAGAPSFSALHPSVQALFVRCFEDGHVTPRKRPNATRWHQALSQAEAGLTTCSANAQHHYGDHLDRCPWCDRAKQFGQDPFPARHVPWQRRRTRRRNRADVTRPGVFPGAAAPAAPVRSAFRRPHRVSPPRAMTAFAVATLVAAVVLSQAPRSTEETGLGAPGAGDVESTEPTGAREARPTERPTEPAASGPARAATNATRRPVAEAAPEERGTGATGAGDAELTEPTGAREVRPSERPTESAASGSARAVTNGTRRPVAEPASEEPTAERTGRNSTRPAEFDPPPAAPQIEVMRLSPTTGHLKVAASYGIEVRIDDELAFRGRHAQSLAVSPGMHRVRVVGLDVLYDETHDVAIESTTVVDLSSPPAAAVRIICSNPRNCQVSSSGRSFGAAPVTVRAAKGVHLFEARWRDGRSRTVHINVKEGVGPQVITPTP